MGIIWTIVFSISLCGYYYDHGSPKCAVIAAIQSMASIQQSRVDVPGFIFFKISILVLRLPKTRNSIRFRFRFQDCVCLVHDSDSG